MLEKEELENPNRLMTCPLSGQNLLHPCPVTNCPANLSRYDKTRSCAYIIPQDELLRIISDITGLENERLTSLINEQVEDLKLIISHVKGLPKGGSSNNSCPNCGYVERCSFTSICEDRKEAINQILVNKEKAVASNMTASSLWKAVITGKDSFLTKDQHELLVNLLDQRHYKQCYRRKRSHEYAK